MMKNLQEQRAFQELEVRIKTILPEEYQDSYDDVLPVSMGSAALKYGTDLKVEWNEIWTTFCDRAMAGGPPHKGTLLEPGSRAEIGAQPGLYRQAVEEICRGVDMVTGLAAEQSPTPGWVRVECVSHGMAGWLLRAIVMENVSARGEGSSLLLPAGPGYRLEKEIRNVITAIAKAFHYWIEHMGKVQQRLIATLFEEMAAEWPLVQPALAGGGDFQEALQQTQGGKMTEAIGQATGLRPSSHQYVNWLGLNCPDVRSAIWMTRAMVASNVLSRREETVLFVPVNPASDPHGETVVRLVVRTHGFAAARHIL